MARALTPTLLNLDRFAQLAGISPLHFNQVEVAGLAPSTTCDDPMLQYSWQDADRIGREEVAQTIAQVEQLLNNILGFPVGPAWIADERQSFAAMRPVGNSSSGLNSNWLPVSLTTKQGHVISGGIEAKTLISASEAVTYTDADGDGYDETATIIVATAITVPGEIAIYYPGHSGDTAWQIAPVQVSISGGNATIVTRRERLVLESLLERMDSSAANGLVDGNFLTTVDVYRHYNDPSQQVTFLWEGGSCGCGDVGCEVCSFETQTGCLRTRHPRLGIVSVSPAEWDVDEQAFLGQAWSVARQPDHAIINYKAGDSLSFWERSVTNLTLAMLDRPLCSCKALEAQIQYQREDLAYVQTGSRFQIGNRVKDNPIGSTRAAVNAWNLVQRIAQA